jgi:hypothetical protein
MAAAMGLVAAASLALLACAEMGLAGVAWTWLVAFGTLATCLLGWAMSRGLVPAQYSK